ncbi:hypothetical protein [Azospirillum doebereinerae]
MQASAFGGIPLIPTLLPQGEKGYPLAKGAVSLQMRDV